MIKVIWLQWRWLCRVGLHEYGTAYKNGRLAKVSICAMCGKKRKRAPAPTRSEERK